MPKRKTLEQFKEEVYIHTNGEVKVISTEYKNKESKIEFIHKECGNTFIKRASQFLSTPKCPCCGKEFNLNDYFQIHNEKDYRAKFKELVDKHFKLIGKYIDNNTKITVEHKICKSRHDVLPLRFLMNPICQKCRGGEKMTHDDFVNRMFTYFKTEYVVLSEYKDKYTPITMVHTKCGTQFDIEPFRINYKKTNRVFCSKCCLMHKWSKGKLQKSLNDIFPKEFRVMDDYKGFDTPIFFKHLKCKEKFKLSPNVILKNAVCPICEKDISLHEKKIIRLLEANKVNFIKEYRFDDCKNVQKLSFDFAVFDKQNNLLLLIEYDGEQHYLPIGKFGGTDNLRSNKKRDEIKNKYCKDNNIDLFRIPFWEKDNLKKILRTKFKEYKIKIK